ncbi:hypothetical protein [Herbidospora cretacea]|uniref:hypothetical protein n=1 Tax=Herbidospora cretacea TaxID=28444 RepID=UPI0007746FB5|nr:hypothetical protein [Herbidospora cretacea]
MADVRLSDYAGHIFLEMVRAREMADDYSRKVAERYARDPVMRFFPAPRFRVPKIQLSIPVLVSGARFDQAVRFAFGPEEFTEFIVNRAHGVRARVRLAQGLEAGAPPGPPRTDRLMEIIRQFYEHLAANGEPAHPDPIVVDWWGHVFATCLEEADLLGFYTERDSSGDLLAETTKEVLAEVRRHTVVGRSEIESLLVDPETAVVAGGSTEASVFTVHVELVEEGVYFRSVRDEETGHTRTLVEFD